MELPLIERQIFVQDKGEIVEGCRRLGIVIGSDKAEKQL